MSSTERAVPVIEPAAIFSDGMVIQHGTPFPVWGRASPGIAINLRFLGEAWDTLADAEGKWQITMAPPAAGGPYCMIISAPGADSLTINDIYAGEVWLGSGQSNMELPMARLRDNYPEEFDAASWPVIREYRLPYAWDFSGPREDIPRAQWVQANAETLAFFSGTGWFFAKNINRKSGVPVGIIIAAVGGAPIESLMSREALAAFPEKIAQSAPYADQTYQDQAAKQGQLSLENWNRKNNQNDAGLTEEWFCPETTDASWNEIQLPGNFSVQTDLKDFCGIIWLRRSFRLAKNLADKDLRVWLGTIVDADKVYINGQQAGETTYRYPPRKYNIPAAILREGENQITIRVTVNNGEGGITTGKPFAIFHGADPFAASAVKLQGAWKYKIGVRSEGQPRPLTIHWLPMGLFNGMIAPLLRYAVRGIIFYQGESNCDTDPALYGALFTAMIRDWRGKKGWEKLPFLFVQLPLFGPPGENREESAWAVLRDEQRSVLCLPATGMAAALDLGEWNDLHPLNKKDIGLRLALAAEQVSGKNHAGAGCPVPAPLADSISRNGNSVTVFFASCGSGLTVEGDTVFVSIVTENGTMLRRPAQIEQPNRIIVDITGIENPKRILYAWADNPADRQLYNSDGFPAIPFRLNI